MRLFAWKRLLIFKSKYLCECCSLQHWELEVLPKSVLHKRCIIHLRYKWQSYWSLSFRARGGILRSIHIGKTPLTYQIWDSGHFPFHTASVLYLHWVIGLGNTGFPSYVELVVSSTSCPRDHISGAQVKQGFSMCVWLNVATQTHLLCWKYRLKSSTMSFSTMWLSFKVCREFQRGNCTRGENDCRYAHPIDIAMIDTNENTVTVCMDYIKGRCSREKCKYFHPPAHLQAKIKAAQHQVNQTAAAAMVSGALIKLYFNC